MGELVLLIVAAAWAAVLLPPLLRSRFENRPNSSVTDFNRQLSRLQGSVPSRATGSLRTAGRPLVPSQHNAYGRREAQINRRPRVHGDARIATAPRTTAPADLQRRRRANTFTGLLLSTISLLFLAATTKEVALFYLFAVSFLALCAYVYMLVSMRERASSPWGPASRSDDWLRR